MKTYQTNEYDSLSIDNMTIPQGHRLYVKALEEVEEGEAEILPYRKPKEVVDHLGYLASTDWYVTRFTETGVEIPEEVLDKRAEARLEL